MNIVKILDLKEMPDFNWNTQKDRGTWSTQDVTDKTVYLDSVWEKPVCIEHGAMNCVNESKEIWRCLICGRACYTIVEPTPQWRHVFKG